MAEWIHMAWQASGEFPRKCLENGKLGLQWWQFEEKEKEEEKYRREVAFCFRIHLW